MQGSVINGYRLGMKLGEGAFSKVYKAKSIKDHSEIAIKVLESNLDKKIVKQFQNEYRLGKKFSHSNLPRFIFHATYEGKQVIGLNFFDGRRLNKMIKKQELAKIDLYKLFRELVSALKFCEELGVVHNDLKPENIMINSEGEPFLFDFGISTKKNIFGQYPTAPSVQGTAVYMSPEQIKGEKLTPSSDIYALGIIFYECVLGKPPFVGLEQKDVFKMHCSVKAPSLRRKMPRISRNFESLVLSMLAKEPNDRPHGFSMVSHSLDNLSIFDE